MNIDYRELLKGKIANYLHLKKHVRDYIETSYLPSQVVKKKVESMGKEFQHSIGIVPSDVLTEWLIEWGITVVFTRNRANNDFNYHAFVKPNRNRKAWIKREE